MRTEFVSPQIVARYYIVFITKQRQRPATIRIWIIGANMRKFTTRADFREHDFRYDVGCVLFTMLQNLVRVRAEKLVKFL